MMNLREARREVIDLKEEESRVVLEGVDMAIPKDLFGVGRKLGEDKIVGRGKLIVCYQRFLEGFS